MHVLALDIKTGKKVWDVVTDDYKRERTYDSGPLVVKDKVLIGAGNCGPGSANSDKKVALYSPPGGCFISGHDLATGKELWRFNTTALHDDPGGNTWNNLPDDKRDGAAIWVAGQYDPELNLTYWGTGSPSPWSTITRGTFGAASLYVDSTVALNPDTGKLVWYYQHVPHDPYDQDYAFERIIVPVTVRGERHKAVITVGKPGIFEAMDAATGKFLFAVDPGAQNDISVDPVTGSQDDALLNRRRQAAEKLPERRKGRQKLPGRRVQPVNQPVLHAEIRQLHGKVGRHPGVRFLALDLWNTQKLVWDIRTRVPQSSALLATAGGLVFSATPDRYFRAFDDESGKVLWTSPRLNDVPNAFPITYTVDGKQYIAMPAGDPGLEGNWALNYAPELGAIRGSKSSVLWVFELP